MSHRALGRLRGKAEPREDILDRISAIRPTFRVHWHPWEDGRDYWLIANHVGTSVMRDMGRHALDRFLAQPDPKPFDIAGAELLMDGGYVVRRFTEEEFGTDYMVARLQSSDEILARAEREEAEAVKLRQLKTEWQLATDERLRNAAYKAYLEKLTELRPEWMAEQEAMLKEAWPYYMREARSVVLPRAITPVEVA